MDNSTQATGVGTGTLGPAVGPLAAGSPVRGLDIVIFTYGSFASALAYQSLQPVLLAAAILAGGLALLFLPWIGGRSERRIFVRSFCVSWLMSGVAALYVAILKDPVQLQGDASSFFEFASDRARTITLQDLQVLHEGALAIVLWGIVYDALAAMGFARERFVGILINVMAIGLTSVVALKMARRIYGEDAYRFRRLTLLISVCGLFWLFAGIHLRDAVVLLSITVLAYTWVNFLSDPRFGARFWLVVLSSAGGVVLLAFLRWEFTFVPLAMAGAGTAALLFGRKAGRSRLRAYVLVAIGLVVSGLVISAYGEQAGMALGTANVTYQELAAQHSDGESLGMALIVTQPLPVRLVLGSIYLFVFPIPFWAGFGLDSAYHAFKSFNALYFYFVIPLLALGGWQLLMKAEARTPAMLFLLLASLGFTLGIAGSSLETRHFGAFLPLLFMVALLPDLRSRSNWVRYKILLAGLLCAVAVVHGAWILLKLL